MDIASEALHEEAGAGDTVPKFLFKFHRIMSMEQIAFFRSQWDGAARENRPFAIGPDVDLYQLVDGRYVAVTAAEIVSKRELG